MIRKRAAHRLAHLPGGVGPASGDLVSSRRSLGQHLVDGRRDRPADVAPAKAVGEHHADREDHRDRVGGALAGDVGCRPVHRLEDARRLAADRRRRREPEAAADRRGQVGEDVAEEVLGQDHVVGLRLGGEVHGEGVHELVREPDLLELRRLQLGDDTAPQLRRRQHVGLVHRDDAAVAPASELERPPCDPLDLLARVAALVAGGVLLERFLAEVEAAGQLTHDDQVDVGVAHRAQVGVGVKLLAEPEQPLLGAPRGAVPTRASDGAQQDGVGRLHGGPDVGREWVSVLVDGIAAEGQMHLPHADAEQLRGGVDDAARLGHHLWADPIAREAGDDRQWSCGRAHVVLGFAGKGYLIRLRQAPAPVRPPSWHGRMRAGRPQPTPR